MMLIKGPTSNGFDFDICCQGHDPEQYKGESLNQYLSYFLFYVKSN